MTTLTGNRERALPFTAVLLLSVMSLWASSFAVAVEKPTMASISAIPPLVAAESTGDLPNILLVLDNSNSMDEAPNGRAVGSTSPESRSMIARNAISTMMDDLQNRVRMGLMAYKQKNVIGAFITATHYDVSYEPQNYDPDFTGDRVSLTKRFQSPSPTSGNVTSYYNVSAATYWTGNPGELYCYSLTADFDNGLEDPASGPWDDYSCFAVKDKATDTLPGNPAEASQGFKSYQREINDFSPSDSDIAAGILDFGAHINFLPVGDAWFSNSSPGPGMQGMLYEPVAQLDATHKQAISDWLAAPTYDSSDENNIIRNAGLTPLEGTLATALNYFQGNLSSDNYIDNTTVDAPPDNNCANQDFVVLVTDGLPSVDKNGDRVTDTAAALQEVADEAAALAAEGVLTYVVGFALPAGVDPSALDVIAEAGGTLRAYSADTEAELTNVLVGISEDVLNRTSSASAASVVSNSSLGAGAVFQALYRPLYQLGANEMKWGGIVHGLFIDDQGRLREDTNGDQALSPSLSVDREVQLFYDEVADRTRFRRYTGGADSGKSLEGVYELEDLKPIWDARDELAALGSAVTTQRAYTANANTGRYIFTSIDAAINGVVDSGDVLPFTPQSVTDSARFQRYLDLAGTSYSATDLVDFIRGKEGLSGYRSRTVDYDRDGSAEPWLLGDVVHSSPLIVGAPKSRFDVRYQDDTYREFRQKYENRRQVLYVGANDGMLHAFNVGFYDLSAQQYVTTPDASSSKVAHPLGAELWAYVPEAVLPHLKWLADPDYNHVYYVDGSPKAYDVNIFDQDADHPHGWGTILVVPMRLGGAPYPVDNDGDGSEESALRSAILIFDITNPEQPPELLAELSDPDMGYTTPQPTVVKWREQRTDASGLPAGTFVDTTTNAWYLIAGSGPAGADALTQGTSDQLAKLFVYDLETMQPVAASPVDLPGDRAAFVGDITAQDWSADYRDDIAYFGTIAGTPEEPGGELLRYVLDWSNGLSGTTNYVLSPCGGNVVSNLVCGVIATIPILEETESCTEFPLLGLICETVTTVVDTITKSAGLPFQHAPRLGRDANGNAWIFVGSGRFLVPADSQSDVQQFMFGIKEPVATATDAEQAFSFDPVARTDLVNTTDVKVYSSGSVANTPLLDGVVAATFNDFLSQMQNEPGWYRKLRTDTAKTAAQAEILGNALLYNEYVPSTQTCEPEGEGFLNVVDFRTGTPTPFGALGFDDTEVLGMGFKSIGSISLGRGLPSIPVIHEGTKGSTVITTTSTGAIDTTLLQSAPVTTGRQSWREIPLD